MKSIKNKFLSILLIFICSLFFVLDSHAQEQPEWWMTNSLKIDSIPPGMLFHAEGDYSFYTSTGNVKTTIHKGSLNTFIRNGRFMFETLGSIDYQKIQIRNNPESLTHVFSLNPKLIYDLTSIFQSETGIVWEKDDGHFLDLRSIYYTGLGYNQMEHRKLGKLLFLAAGYQTLKSTTLPPQLATFLATNIVEDEKFVLYAMQSLVLKVSPKLQIIEKFTFIQSFDEANTYRTDLELQAQFAVSRHISGLIAYQAKYQNEALIPEITPFIEKLNTSLTFGVRVNI